MDTAYKIELFNFIPLDKAGISIYAWVSHPDFEKDLKELELTGKVEQNQF